MLPMRKRWVSPAPKRRAAAPSRRTRRPTQRCSGGSGVRTGVVRCVVVMKRLSSYMSTKNFMSCADGRPNVASSRASGSVRPAASRSRASIEIVPSNGRSAGGMPSRDSQT